MTCNGALVIAHLLDSDNQSGLLDFRNKELCIIGTNSLTISLFHSYYFLLGNKRSFNI